MSQDSDQRSLFGSVEPDGDRDVVAWIPTSSTAVPRRLDDWDSPARETDGVVLYGLRTETVAALAAKHPEVEVSQCVLDLLDRWGSENHPRRRRRKPPSYGRIRAAIEREISSHPGGALRSHDRPVSSDLLWRAAAAT